MAECEECGATLSDGPPCLRCAEFELYRAFYSNPGELEISGACVTLQPMPEQTSGHKLKIELEVPAAFPAEKAKLLRLTCDTPFPKDELAELEKNIRTALVDAEPGTCGGILEQLQELPEAVEIAEVEDLQIAVNVTRGKRCTIEEKHIDLFAVSNEYSLCHCVAEDLEMSAGIATKFVKEFGGRQTVQAQDPKIGDAPCLNKNGRYIYYLITKKKSSGKPVIGSVEKAIESMRNHIVEHKVRKLAMPKMGAGLDRLNWEEVRQAVLRIFDDVEIEILVCVWR